MTDAKELMKALSKKSTDARLNRTREDFGEMMERYMKEKGLSSKALSPASNLSDRTIRRMKGDDTYRYSQRRLNVFTSITNRWINPYSYNYVTNAIKELQMRKESLCK